MKGKSLLAAMVLMVVALVPMAGCETGGCPEAGSDTMIRQVVIKASAENVWKYILGDARVEKDGIATLEWWPHWEAKNFDGSMGPGRSYEITEEYAGRKYQGTVVMTDYVPNRKYVASYSGSITREITILVAPYEDGSKLVFVFAGISTQNKAERDDLAGKMESALAMIKQKAEAMPPVESAGAGEAQVIVPATTRASVEINAPVERVFSYAADFNNLVNYYPGLKSVTVEGRGQGMVARWTMEAEGQSIEGESVIVDYVPNLLIAGTSPDGETWSWMFLPADGKTKVILVVQAFPVAPDNTRETKEKIDEEYHGHLMLMLNNLKDVIEK